MNRLSTTRSDIRIWPRSLAYWYYSGHFIASYCFQGLTGLANLLSAISCYKFHILKNLQQNMKVTIICHLTALLFICNVGQMLANVMLAKWQIIVTFMFSCWSWNIWSLYKDIAESKLANPIKPQKRYLAIMCPV